MSAYLYSYQLDALSRMKNGCILNGGVGTGKSITAIAYYFTKNGGTLEPNFQPMLSHQNLYIITTAKKRDSKEWEIELARFYLTAGPTPLGPNPQEIVIDSWNNIKKYEDRVDSFFIFDEQRVVGYGAWTKSFLKIAKHNKWIMLSATPGDTWSDYIPVFIANGFYKNKSEFLREHAVFNRFSKYPKIDRYISTGRLNKLRRDILVEMTPVLDNVKTHQYVSCDYDMVLYKMTMRNRWDYENSVPIEDASKLCIALRKIVNTSEERLNECINLCKKHHRVIIFYNFTYELELLRQRLSEENIPFSEWNGQKHQEILNTDEWAYLVQYMAGNEGWNCITSDTIIFYSQNYSYRIMTQAAGRIDRANTPFNELYYYHLTSSSSIDAAITKALKAKRNFNESTWKF